MSDPDDVVETQPVPPVFEALEFERLRLFLHVFGCDVKSEHIAPVPSTKPNARLLSSSRLIAVVEDLASFPTWVLKRVQWRCF
jgi:hypothetical protein